MAGSAIAKIPESPSVGSFMRKRFNSFPFAYHQELELEISSLTNLGAGLARVQLEGAGEGEAGALRTWVVFVPFALPGERVRARVWRNYKNYSEADVVEVLTPSIHRVEPLCPLFGRCGGCQYQNLSYEQQLAWKRRQVQELLRHMAGVEFSVNPVIPSPRQFGYRSKITPHFHRPREDKPLAVGFLRQGTRSDVVDVPACPLATAGINAKLRDVRDDVLSRRDHYTKGATLLLREAGGRVVTDPGEVICEEVPLAAAESAPSAPPPTLRLSFLARDFFQNNPSILPAFTGYVRGQASAGGARFLVDAYCGSGLFCLSAASAFEKAVGIEISETSVAWAKENAEANGIPNAEFRAGTASAIFDGLPFPPSETAVVIDPPRKGCDPDFLQQLTHFRPSTVVYVSCDPATQMRDLKDLLAAGYTLSAVQPFDLFPQTRHLECVVTLRIA